MSPATTIAKPNDITGNQWEEHTTSIMDSKPFDNIEKEPHTIIHSTIHPSNITSPPKRKNSRITQLFHSPSLSMRKIDNSNDNLPSSPIPTTSSSLQHENNNNDQDNINTPISKSRRSSIHSFILSESPSAKLSRSIGSILRHFHHTTSLTSSQSSSPNLTDDSSSNNNQHHSTTSGSHTPIYDHIDRLERKYGPYIKPIDKKKHLGGNKKNVASGATAVIRLVRHDQTVLAVKEFMKKSKNEDEKVYRKRMQNEYCISKSVSGHPHVVDTMDLVLDEHDRWCTVMEYCSGGDLFNLLEERPTLTIMEQSCLFKQLLLGLQHLHKLGIAHRDIKPENLILTQGGTLKIADFGVASVVQTCFEKESHPCYEWCGSESFWSPEMWKLSTADDPYDGRALDCWSAGITYYCIRYHSLPFKCTFYKVPPYPKHAKVGCPAMVAYQAEDGGDRSYQLYFDQHQQDPLQCDLWNGPLSSSSSPSSSSSSSSTTTPATTTTTTIKEKDNDMVLSLEIKSCLTYLLHPDPEQRWTVDQALESEWMKNVELCNDGELPNGWRHYHCIPTTSIK
ncbi:unnamed protein product [Cunninghamella echinulata]